MSAPTLTRSCATPEPAPQTQVRSFLAEDGRYRIEFTSPLLPHPVELYGSGEVAMALHLTARPLPRTATVRQTADLVVYALVTSGLDEIQRQAQISRQAIGDMVRHYDTTGEVRGYAPQWTPARNGLCTTLAWRLGTHADGGLFATPPARADARPVPLD